MMYGIYDDRGAETRTEKDYRQSIRRRKARIAGAVFAVAATMILTPVLSNPDYGAVDVLRALFTADTDSTIGKFLWNIDLPIMVAAFIAGAALSLAGTVMQCLLRNPLASPYTLGLSNAAAFGAAFSIIFVTGGMAFDSFFGDYITPLAAFASAMAATGLILILTKITKVSSETMVLAGIAVSAVFSAGITMMQYIADPVQLSAIVSWMFGSVSFADWKWDFVLAVILVLVFFYFYAGRWDMNAMDAGDEAAKGLGVNTGRFLVVGLVLSSLLSAVVVCKFGVIAFVGLLGPHTARLVIGDDHRYLLPGAVLFGGLLLTAANLAANNIMSPMVLPVGLLTSLLGGPVFIFLLIRRWCA